MGLSDYLTKNYGKGFSVANLRQMRKFYTTYASDQIGQMLSDQFRQFAIALYERLAPSKGREEVYRLALEGQLVEKPEDAVKDPYILEFLGLDERAKYSESELETRIIDHL